MKNALLFLASLFVFAVSAGATGRILVSHVLPDHTRVAYAVTTIQTQYVQLIPGRTLFVEDALHVTGTPLSRGNELLQQQGIRFQENRGQIVGPDGRARDDVLFIANAPGAKLFFRNDGISYVFTESSRARRGIPSDDASSNAGIPPFGRDDIERSYRLDMTLINVNPQVNIRAEGQIPGYVNWYLPHCPAGITGIREYSRIVYENVYDNVDLELFSVSGRMKYNFVVRPGGDPGDIRMQYSGASETAITGDGACAVATPLGRIEEAAPYSYAGDEGNEVSSRFLKTGSVVSFSVGAYDRSKTLVIDPWATYFGGGGTDKSFGGVAADSDGNVFFSGVTYSTDFPVSPGAFQPAFGGASMDAFVAKFDAAGSRLWATYYGGNGNEWSNGTAVDGAGNVVIAGQTNSSDFPISAGAFQMAYAGMGDAFVVKLDADGGRLWATYYGGSDDDRCQDVAVDLNGNVAFTGYTLSKNFPVSSNAFQKTRAKGPNGDAFLVKLTGGGSRAWATYYGGKAYDYAGGVCADPSGNIAFTGNTTSSDFPVTTGAFQKTNAGGGDAFIVKFTSAGSRSWATYYGGSSSDDGNGVVTDGTGNIIVEGVTSSANFPVSAGAFQSTYAGNGDVFILRLTSTGSRAWATYYGGGGTEYSTDPGCDANGNILLTGSTQSTDLPVSASALQGSHAGGGWDAFAVKLFSDGSRDWATYYGGTNTEFSDGGYIDAAGNVLITGNTMSPDFPLWNPYQGTLHSTTDAFVVVLNPSGLFAKQAPGRPVLPSEVRLEQNYPNPFNPSTTIVYSIPADGPVVFRIYDLQGRLIAELVNGKKTAGVHTVVFHARDLPSGVYRYRLEAGGATRSGMMTLVK